MESGGNYRPTMEFKYVNAGNFLKRAALLKTGIDKASSCWWNSVWNEFNLKNK